MSEWLASENPVSALMTPPLDRGQDEAELLGLTSKKAFFFGAGQRWITEAIGVVGTAKSRTPTQTKSVSPLPTPPPHDPRPLLQRRSPKANSFQTSSTSADGGAAWDRIPAVPQAGLRVAEFSLTPASSSLEVGVATSGARPKLGRLATADSSDSLPTWV